MPSRASSATSQLARSGRIAPRPGLPRCALVAALGPVALAAWAMLWGGLLNEWYAAHAAAAVGAGMIAAGAGALVLFIAWLVALVGALIEPGLSRRIGVAVLVGIGGVVLLLVMWP